MNGWIVTWEGTGNHEITKGEGRIAAIVNYRRSSEYVRDLVEFLYVNSLHFQDRFAYAKNKKSNPYPADYVRLADGAKYLDEITCGHNPYLRARRVDNIQVTTDENGKAAVTWQERPRPKIKSTR